MIKEIQKTGVLPIDISSIAYFLEQSAFEFYEQGINKKDIRIWMPHNIMLLVGHSHMRGSKVKRVHKFMGIKVLLGYEYDTVVMSHTTLEAFDVPPKRLTGRMV